MKRVRVSIRVSVRVSVALFGPFRGCNVGLGSAFWWKSGSMSSYGCGLCSGMKCRRVWLHECTEKCDSVHKGSFLGFFDFFTLIGT